MAQTNSSNRNRWLLIAAVVSIGSISLLQGGCSCGSSSSVPPSPITDVFPPQSTDSALVSTLVTATFRDDMNGSTINTTTFTLTVGGAPVAAASVVYDAATKTATLTPAADLVSDTEYRATISSDVENTSGTMPLTNDYVWSFAVSPDTYLVSKNEDGVVGGLNSLESDIDAIGRYVVFRSDAANLVSGISNSGFFQIYRKDTVTGEIRLVSTDVNGLVEGDGDSGSPRISDDGRHIVFSSYALNLGSPTLNGRSQIFLKDMEDNSIDVISKLSDTVAGDRDSTWPDISSNGEYISFVSSATNFGVSNIIEDIFLVDLSSPDTIEQISVNTSGVAADNASTRPSVSDDGQFVAFESLASNLGANNGVSNIYVRDRTNQTTTLISSNCATCSPAGSGQSNNADISDDGQFVVFQSDSAFLIPSDSNIVTDIFLRDTAASTDTVRISETTAAPANDSSINPSISSDGRFIAFESQSTNLDSGVNQKFNIYVSDTSATDDIKRISLNSDNDSNNARISDDGRYISFDSPYSFTIDDTNNGLTDTFRGYNTTFQ